MTRLNINGRELTVDVDPDTPLLWALRDTLGLTGTKFGCGIAQCGACTVHVDGVPMKACITPASAVSAVEDIQKEFEAVPCDDKQRLAAVRALFEKAGRGIRTVIAI